MAYVQAIAPILDGNDLVENFTVTAPLRDERLSPSGALKTWRRYVRPPSRKSIHSIPCAISCQITGRSTR